MMEIFGSVAAEEELKSQNKNFQCSDVPAVTLNFTNLCWDKCKSKGHKQANPAPKQFESH